MPFAVTVEHTYPRVMVNNAVIQDVKIPDGDYVADRSYYNKGGYAAYEIPVPGHSNILIHRANNEDQLDGCIALGKSFGKIWSDKDNFKDSVIYSLGVYLLFMGLAAGGPQIRITVKSA